MPQTLKQFYIARNANIIRIYYTYIDAGEKTREAKFSTSKHLEVSNGLVNSLIHSKTYPYAKPARKIVKKERKAAVKTVKNKVA